MVTSTAKRTSATKAASKSTAVKSAAAKKATKSPAKKATVKAAAKKVAKAAPAKKAAEKSASRTASSKVATRKIGSAPRKSGGPAKVILVDGKPAHNRHFEVTVANHDAAREAAVENGHSLSEVMRAGLIAYGKKTPIAATRSDGNLSLPAAGVRGLKTVFKSGQSSQISAYMAALAGEGWPLQVIASSVVDHGLADTMTRQAVSLRVNKALKADGGLPDDLPEVPPIGMRRQYPTVQVGGGTKALALTKGGRLRDDMKDVTVRIADEDYAKVQVRTKYEGAKVAAVLDDVLARYASGEFKIKAAKKAAR